MSHFIKASTQVRDRDLLKKALVRLGWKFEEGNFKITQYGQTSKAEIKFSDALGLTQEADGTWSMVGDPYHHNGQNLRKYYRQEKQFAADLGTAYAIEEATQKLENMQFHCVDNAEGSVDKDGLIHLTFESQAW
jgi:hypothetical protein